MISRNTIVSLLDKTLRTSEISDRSVNGLQVDYENYRSQNIALGFQVWHILQIYLYLTTSKRCAPTLACNS